MKINEGTLPKLHGNILISFNSRASSRGRQSASALLFDAFPNRSGKRRFDLACRGDEKPPYNHLSTASLRFERPRVIRSGRRRLADPISPTHNSSQKEICRTTERPLFAKRTFMRLGVGHVSSPSRLCRREAVIYWLLRWYKASCDLARSRRS